MANRERLQIFRQGEEDMKKFFDQLIKQLQGIVLRYGNLNNQIPMNKQQQLRDELRHQITTAFLGNTKSWQLYSMVNGKFSTTSPFLAALWPAFYQSVVLGISEQRNILVKALKNHPELMGELTHASVKRPAVVHEIEIRPTVEYDPLHRFVSPSGYDLSDNVWSVTLDARTKLDGMIADGISTGRSSRDLVDDISKFLTPGEALRRTSKPYGTNAAFSAMRLSRTEIAAAHTLASHSAAMKNPFVTQYNVVLSGSHPKDDECDEAADGGPYNKEDTSMLPPLHPHCLCHLEWVTVDDTEGVIAQLQSLLAGDGGEVDNVDVGPGEDLAASIADLFTGKILDFILGGKP